ncbi:MAG: hypothetical protein KJO84_04885, partial [Acidimicrobiia bacterium]|nr:hypothetical protein [Acidimicrobiia bacterium]
DGIEGGGGADLVIGDSLSLDLLPPVQAGLPAWLLYTPADLQPAAGTGDLTVCVEQAPIRSGAVDVNGDRVIDAADVGLIDGYPLVAGLVDIDRDGAIDTEDNGPLGDAVVRSGVIELTDGTDTGILDALLWQGADPQGSGEGDCLAGGPGMDELFGLSGGDIVLGGPDIDFIDGGEGDDLLRGGTEDDQMFGGDGDDTMFGDSGDDDMEGGNGNDLMYGNADNDYMLGNADTDTMFGNDGTDILIGGHDVSGGLDAGDLMDGGTGDDLMAGDNARVVGGELVLLDSDPLPGPVPGTFGNDLMTGGPDDDEMNGGPGDDEMWGDGRLSNGVVVCVEGAEADGRDTVDGWLGDDAIRGCGADDILIGGLGDDTIGGDAGEDVAIGGAGSVEPLDGPGDGRIVVLEEIGGIDTVIDTSTTPTGRPDLVDELIDADLLLGAGSFTSGVAGETRTYAIGLLHDGNDEIDGGAGTDLVVGQGGSDTLLTGGVGADIVVGDRITNALVTGTGIPAAVSTLRLFDPSGASDVVVPAGGLLVAPGLWVDPLAMERGPIGEAMEPHGAGFIGSTLPLAGGGEDAALVAIIPGLLHGDAEFYPSDVVSDDDGDNLLVGDDLDIRTVLAPEVGVLDAPTDALTLEVYALLHGLDDLEKAEDVRRHQVDAEPVATHDVVVSSDFVSGGPGADTLVGGTMTMVHAYDPFAVVGGAEAFPAAGDLVEVLRRTQRVIVDLSFVVHEAQADVVADIPRGGRGGPTMPDNHAVFIDNDHLAGLDGPDALHGDSSQVYLAPVDRPITEVVRGTDVAAVAVRAIDLALEDELDDHLAADHVSYG